VSRLNKVNPDHYTMAVRLTPDELARQRRQQGRHLGGRRRKQKAMPPWMANERSVGGEGGEDAEDEAAPKLAEDETQAEADAAAAETAIGGEETEGAAETRRVRSTKRAATKRATKATRKRGAAARTGSDRGEVTARKGKRPAPRRKTTGRAAGTARPKSTKASGARGTPKTRKAPSTRASAARGGAKQRAGAPGMRKGRTKGKGVTRKTQKKNRS
jgi:hypothetical protein